MSEEVKNLIENLKIFLNEVHEPFENHPFIREQNQYKAIIESTPEMKETLQEIKKDDDELNRFVATSFNYDLELIEKLEQDNKVLAGKIAKYSPDARKKVLDKLSERIKILQELEQESGTSNETK